jgi:hypothetical protein
VRPEVWQRLIGASWAIFGAGLFVLGAVDLVRLAADPQYGWRSTFYEPFWWYVQIGMELFILAGAVIGVGIIAGKRWALLGLKVLAPIALLYLVAYSIFGGERALWVAIGVFALTVVVGMSVYYAYRPHT